MKKSKVALVALIAAAIVAAGVSVVGFTATGIGRNDKKSAHTAQLADKSKATTVRTQIERPLSLSKGEVKNVQVTRSPRSLRSRMPRSIFPVSTKADSTGSRSPRASTTKNTPLR